MKRLFRHISAFISLLAFLMLASCSPVEPDQQGGPDADLPADMMQPGEPVVFSSSVPVAVLTKADGATEQTDGYRYVSPDDPYNFDITMLGAGGVPLATATYSTVASESNVHGYLVYNDPSREPLLWYSFDEAFAFKVVSGSAAVGPDQTTYAKHLAQDRLEGYAGHPHAAAPAPVYKKAKEWYEANKAMGLSEAQDFNKRVPLFLEHKKSKISVILKAGKGVDRDVLRYDRAASLVDVSIFSYPQSGDAVEVKPYLTKADVTYPDGAKIESACYDAIVEPYDYADDAHVSSSKIAAINVSGMKFSFYAANDEKYVESPRTHYVEFLDSYKLEPGRHLVIEVTLSTADRSILITAYVTDWNEYTIGTSCNDYGTSGDAVIIKNAADFAAFLNDDSVNRPGKIAYIAPATLTLPEDWGGTAEQPYVLNATLNAAGAVIETSKPLFDSVNGYLVNAEVRLLAGAGTGLDAAVAKLNAGIIERVSVTSESDDVSLQRAGLVVENTGSIYKCSSSVPVNYTGGSASPVYIGGIAADSHNQTEEGRSSIARIEYCSVTARVGSENTGGVYGAGIVARAQGVVENNSFDYGISLLQESTRFKNIIYGYYDADHPESLTDIDNNQWPTNVKNKLSESVEVVNARPAGQRYSQVLDSTEELKALVTNDKYNKPGETYRVANDFTVSADEWKDDQGNLIGRRIAPNDRNATNCGNVLFNLEGNNKSITLVKGATDSAPMLFSNISGVVRDLTIICNDPVISIQQGTETTSIAPLAYSVSTIPVSSTESSPGLVSNVVVKMGIGAYVEAMAPGGIVVWAYDKGTVDNCVSDSDIRVCLPQELRQDNTFFAGGIVNAAADATISRCRYYRESLADGWIIYPGGTKTSVNVYFGGIVGGTSRMIENVDPCLLVTDSASRTSWNDTLDNYDKCGGIVGYAVYKVDSSLHNGMDEACQGNWWNASTFVKGVGYKVPDLKEEQVIGKRNSVDPSWGSY